MSKYKFKVGEILTILDKTLRNQAPTGRSRLTINNYRTDGWVSITYEDGVSDYLTYSLLEDNWGKLGHGTRLWRVLNNGN